MLDPHSLLEGAGVLAGLTIIGSIVFAESGLLIGFFLPGDTLLFTAGFFAAQGHLPLVWVLVVIFFAAVIGDNVGYTIGRKTGPRLFRKKDGIIFRQEYIAHAEVFYQKHGGKTIILARFVPIVRTFAPLVAGVGKMSHKKFFLYNVVGAGIWTGLIVMLGYWLGSLINPHVMERAILLAISLAMVFTFGPTLYHLLKEPRFRAAVKKKFEYITTYRQRKSARSTKKIGTNIPD